MPQIYFWRYHIGLKVPQLVTGGAWWLTFGAGEPCYFGFPKMLSYSIVAQHIKSCINRSRACTALSKWGILFTFFFTLVFFWVSHFFKIPRAITKCKQIQKLNFDLETICNMLNQQKLFIAQYRQNKKFCSSSFQVRCKLK